MTDQIKKIKVSMNINTEKWANFRSHCVLAHKTATEVVEQMITDYLQKQEKGKK